MQAIIFTGIQASGKSSFYKQQFFNSHVRISLDLLNTRNKEAKFIDTCFLTQAQFVIDNTNPTLADRAKYITKAKENKYEIVGFFFSTSLVETFARNSLRKGKEKIPEIGIKACFKKLEIPKLDEGFDQLFIVTIENGKFITTEVKHEI